MLGKTFLKTPFLDLLPQALRHDEDVIAFSKTVDVLWALILPQIRNILIWSRIDELEEPLLSTIAHQMHLKGYEGWHLAETLEQKRRLVKDGYKSHFYKGTRWALERVFGLLDIPGDVTEWWEAPAPDFPAYTFDMDVYAYKRRVGQTFYFDIINLIESLKNKRSHLRHGTVHIKSEGALRIGGATWVRRIITARPIRPQSVESRSTLPTMGGGMRVIRRLALYPLTPTRVTSSAELPTVGAASRLRRNITTYPLTPSSITSRTVSLNALPVGKVTTTVTANPNKKDTAM